MAEHFVSRGFVGKRRLPESAGRLPPGQYIAPDFPVLSAGPTPPISLAEWSLTVEGLVGQPVRWSWQQFTALPAMTYTVDIHCVTKWSKLDTHWKGVSLDTLFEAVELDREAAYIMAHSYGGYSSNVPLSEVVSGQAFVAYEYEGGPLPPEHGGPARLVVPHLYFWKSAKWVHSIELMAKDKPGFWESLGYNIHGDPWKEERYWGD